VGEYRETTGRKGTMGRNEDDRRERMRGDKKERKEAGM
jgi:hypothetical protein